MDPNNELLDYAAEAAAKASSLESDDDGQDDDIMDTSAPPSAKRSKPSTPLQATTHLLEISSRIENAVSELKQITMTLSGDQTHYDANEALLSLKNSLISFFTLASQGIIDSAAILTRIQGVKKLHRKHDAEWKRKVMDDSKEKDTRRPQLRFVDAYVTSCYLNDEDFWRKQNKKKRPKTSSQLDYDEDLHPSSTTSIYERVTALSQTPLELAEDQKSVVLPLPQVKMKKVPIWSRFPIGPEPKWLIYKD
jgi:hypothetical protein